MIDLTGLTIGLYAAIALRSLVRDPEADPLEPPLGPGERLAPVPRAAPAARVLAQPPLRRRGSCGRAPGRIVASVVLVAALALAFAIGESQHFTTFGLYLVATVTVSVMISLLRGATRSLTGTVMRAAGVRRRVLLVGAAEQVEQLRATLGAARSGIDYDFAGHVTTPRPSSASLRDDELDELIVADDGLVEAELLEVVEAAHRRGVKVRIAPRTTELLLERGEYVPGHGVPLFELRPPVLAGSRLGRQARLRRVRLAARDRRRAPALDRDRGGDRPDLARRGLLRRRAGRARGAARSGCSSSARWSPDAAGRQASLEPANEASGALFKIRNDPRVTRVGRVLRRFSIDEVPNVINVLRGEMSLVGPRPLPLRDYRQLEPWHRRRSNVLPGMTGLWQIAGRSDLTFDDLVRLDFYYLENWSLWLDITILVKTLPAVAAKRGAY